MAARAGRARRSSGAAGGDCRTAPARRFEGRTGVDGRGRSRRRRCQDARPVGGAPAGTLLRRSTGGGARARLRGGGDIRAVPGALPEPAALSLRRTGGDSLRLRCEGSGEARNGRRLDAGPRTEASRPAAGKTGERTVHLPAPGDAQARSRDRGPDRISPDPPARETSGASLFRAQPVLQVDCGGAGVDPAIRHCGGSLAARLRTAHRPVDVGGG